ncbi:MAG: cation:proton antiporter [Acidimicrobiia bacterium]|jgi:Kef-type K+ transport system membrane component KefB
MHGEILMLALVLGAALLGGRVAARFGYPAILGEIAAGIIFGPPLIGILQRNESIDILGEFGILLMMLYIGMHLDLTELRRASVPGLLAATGGFLVPTAAGMALMLAVGRSFLEALFVGLAMGVTSLATKSRILVDLKILDTRIAHVLVAGALLSDVAVLVIFAAVIGPDVSEGISVGTALITGGKALAFGLGAWLVGMWILPAIKKRFADRDLDRGALLLAVIVFGLGFAYAAELAGIHAILGAFVAGLFIDKRVMEPKVAKDVQQKLATMSVGVLAPFFFVSAGFEVSLDVFRTDLPLLLTVIVIATVGKVVGTALFYLPSGNGWREGVVVGAGMNGRGAVEIIVAEIALARGLIERDVFSILVFMALFTTATVPVLLTLGVKWLRRRGELVRAGGRDRALIIGAGVIARRLAEAIHRSMPVTLLDTNRANLVAGEREGLTVKAGSGLDEVALEGAGVEEARQVIAATPNAEVNVLTAQLAVDFGVPDVSVLLRESDHKTFESRLADADIKILRAPEDFAGWEHALNSGRAVAETLELPEDLERFRDASNPLWVEPDSPTGEFPVVVVSNGDRSPYTTEVRLGDSEHVIVLRRLDVPTPARTSAATGAGSR